MNCPRCGAPVQKGMQYCSACGALAATAAPPPAQQYQGSQQLPQQAYPQRPYPQQPYPQQPYPQQPYPQQPYPYQYPPPQPYTPPKDGTSTLGKVIVIAIVLLVVVVVIGAVVFFMFIASVEDNLDDGSKTVRFSSPNVQPRQINGTTYWDATIPVSSVDPSDAAIEFTDLRAILRDQDGALLSSVRLVYDMPSLYDDGSDGTVSVEAWFLDENSDLQISAGDSVKLTGMTSDYERATLELQWNTSDIIGTVTLPTNFP